MKVKDIVEKIDDAIFDVWDKDEILYTNNSKYSNCTEKDYNSCKNREVDYITLRTHINYAENNCRIFYSSIRIQII